VVDLILVNGLPGSGKTTLANGLARQLDAPLIAKDAIKEAVADAGSLRVRRMAV
jgi:predicted kinase